MNPKLPSFQKKSSLVDRFRMEMMQADERRQQALFVPAGGSITVLVVSNDQQTVIERHDVQDKEAAMDSIHAELEDWIQTGGRNGTCNILSVDVLEARPDGPHKPYKPKQHGFTGIANAKTVTIPCPFCDGIESDDCECCIGKGVIKTVAKEPDARELTHDQVMGLQMNGFID